MSLDRKRVVIFGRTKGGIGRGTKLIEEFKITIVCGDERKNLVAAGGERGEIVVWELGTLNQPIGLFIEMLFL